MVGNAAKILHLGGSGANLPKRPWRLSGTLSTDGASLTCPKWDIAPALLPASGSAG